MKIFVIPLAPSGLSTQVAVVDPGLRNLGLLILNRQPVRFKFQTLDIGIKPLELSLPELIDSVVRWVSLLKKKYLDGIQGPLVVEYTFLSGKFSVGLSVFLSVLVSSLKEDPKGITKILLVPPVIPQYLLRSRKITWGQQKKYTQDLATKMNIEGMPEKWNPHISDAFLIFCFLSPAFVYHHGGEVRPLPENFETVVLKELPNAQGTQA